MCPVYRGKLHSLCEGKGWQACSDIPAASGAAGGWKQIAVMKEGALKKLSDVTYGVSSELALK